MAVINNATDHQVTQYNVITGGASNVLNNVAPSATSGVPVISQGSSSQPVFGTAVVAGGGTGDTSFTAYSVITGGTTSTGALQNVSGVGTSGQLLTSNGAAALPSWQTGSAVGSSLVLIQTQTPSGVTSITFSLSSTYKNYMINFSNLTMATGAATLGIQISNDGGGTFKSTSYLGNLMLLSNASTTIGNTTGTARLIIAQQVASAAMMGTVWLSNVEVSSLPIVTGTVTAINQLQIPFGGYNGSALITDTILIGTSTGNFSGTVSLYGLVQ